MNAQAKARFEEVNKEIKEHNQHFLQLSNVTETLRRKLAFSKH